MSLNRERLLSHIKDQDAKQVLVKVLDKAEIVLNRTRFENTDFLDPYHLDLAKGILRGLDLSWLAWGGFSAAERCKLALGPSFRPLAAEDAEVAVLHAKGRSEFHSLNHRDYLGALLALGIRREKVGDIISQPEQGWVIVDTSIADFVCQNLAMVGKVPVEVTLSRAEEIEFPPERFNEIRTTVASLRLDAVAGEGFKLSRGKIAQEIEAGRVKVNWRPVDQLSFKIQEGDTISCRGLGRVIVAEVRGETKKGRIALLLKRLT